MVVVVETSLATMLAMVDLVVMDLKLRRTTRKTCNSESCSQPLAEIWTGYGNPGILGHIITIHNIYIGGGGGSNILVNHLVRQVLVLEELQESSLGSPGSGDQSSCSIGKFLSATGGGGAYAAGGGGDIDWWWWSLSVVVELGAGPNVPRPT